MGSPEVPPTLFAKGHFPFKSTYEVQRLEEVKRYPNQCYGSGTIHDPAVIFMRAVNTQSPDEVGCYVQATKEICKCQGCSFAYVMGEQYIAMPFQLKWAQHVKYQKHNPRPFLEIRLCSSENICHWEGLFEIILDHNGYPIRLSTDKPSFTQPWNPVKEALWSRPGENKNRNTHALNLQDLLDGLKKAIASDGEAILRYGPNPNQQVVLTARDIQDNGRVAHAPRGDFMGSPFRGGGPYVNLQNTTVPRFGS